MRLESAALDYAEPGEHFYVVVFGSQGTPARPALTHTWATVVRSVESPERSPTPEVHTISWLPATLEIHPLDFHVETGANLDLHKSVAFALGTGQHVSMWGPYECRASVYLRFLVQKEFLESERIGYQCVDNVGEAVVAPATASAVSTPSATWTPSTAGRTTRSSGSGTPPASTSSTACTRPAADSPGNRTRLADRALKLDAYPITCAASTMIASSTSPASSRLHFPPPVLRRGKRSPCRRLRPRTASPLRSRFSRHFQPPKSRPVLTRAGLGTRTYTDPDGRNADPSWPSSRSRATPLCTRQRRAPALRRGRQRTAQSSCCTAFPNSGTPGAIRFPLSPRRVIMSSPRINAVTTFAESRAASESTTSIFWWTTSSA